MIALDALNTLKRAEFAAALGAIFEHSPWVAERAAGARPFKSRLQLLEAMRAVVHAGLPEERLALIRAHPELGTRGGSRAALTEASAGEQRRAGLDACTPEQWVRLHELNAAYVAKFSMPFILAVRGHDPESIIAACARRLSNEMPSEQRTALHEIGLIAGYRLAAAVSAPAGAEVLAMQERLGRGADAASAQLREWMQAAELDVTLDGARALHAWRRSGLAHGVTLALGVHYDSQSRALRYDGRTGLLTGIALVQRLQEKRIELPFDLCLIAPMDDAKVWDGASPADADAPCGCVTLAQVARETGDEEGAGCLAMLRGAGLAEGNLVIVRRGPAGIYYRAAAPLDSAMLDRAVRALEEFLLQNGQIFNHEPIHNGSE